MKRLIATVATAGLALAGIAVAAATAGAASTARTAATAGAVTAAKTSGIAWKPCPGDFGAKFGAQCGFLSVPLDYAKPHGTQIKLAVSVVWHKKTAKYQGIMLTNPGGPGGSGLVLSLLATPGAFSQLGVPNHGGDGYDWIGFDPRGVGSSVPALQCDPNYNNPPRPDYVPSTAALKSFWLNKAKGYAQACKKNDTIGLLNHDKTTDTVADMESIRKAFHQNKVNYYGFSYGTYLGQVYASLHPKQVRRMVLDSNVDARGVWYQANLDQDVAFDKGINLWFGWVAKYNKVFGLGDTAKKVHDAYYAELNKLRKSPIKGSPDGGTTQLSLGPDEFTDVFQQAAYYRSTWTPQGSTPGLGETLVDIIKKGNADKFATLYSGNLGAANDNSFVGYNAVQCTDVQWPTSWAKWQKDNDAIYKAHPFLTWSNAWFNAPCLFWPAKAGTPVKINGAKVAPALLIDETNDSATPYPGSLYTRSLFPQSRLLAEPGGGTHADSLSGDACVDNTIAAYLANGTLPARTGKAGYGADKICAPIPDPVPGAMGAKSEAVPPEYEFPFRVHF